MSPSRRYGVNKQKSAKQFRGNSRKTKAANMHGGLARGGWRL